MSRFNTGNPLSSLSEEDFYDNSMALDEAMNSTEPTWRDRFGVEKPTIDAALKSAGFMPAGFDFVTGGTLQPGDRNKAVYNPAPNGDNNWYRWNGAFPKEIAANSQPNPKDENNWVLAHFRIGIAEKEALRRTYLEAGYNLVEGSFETGGILVNINDVLLQERTGKAFSGPAGTVAAGTNPANGGFVDRSSALLRGVSQKTFNTTTAMISAAATLKIGDLVSTAGHTTVGVGSADYVVSTDIARPFLDISLGDGRIAKMLIKDYIDPASCGVDTTGIQPAADALAQISKYGSVTWQGSLYIDKEFIFQGGNDLLGQGERKSLLLFSNTNAGKGIIKSTRSKFSNFGCLLKDLSADFTGRMITLSVQYDYYLYGITPRIPMAYNYITLDKSCELTATSYNRTGRFIVVDTGDIDGVPLSPLATSLGVYGLHYENMTVNNFYCPLTLLNRTRADQAGMWIHSNRFLNWNIKNSHTDFEALIEAATPRAASFSDNHCIGWVTQPLQGSSRIATIEGAGVKFIDCFFWDMHLLVDPYKAICLRKSVSGNTTWLQHSSIWSDDVSPPLEFVRCPFVRDRIFVENFTTNIWPLAVKCTDKYGNGDMAGDTQILANATYLPDNIYKFMAVSAVSPATTVGCVGQCTFKIKSKWPLSTEPFRGAIYAIDIAINVKVTATGFDIKTHLLTPYTGIKTGIDIYADNPRVVDGEMMLDIVAVQATVTAPFPAVRPNDISHNNGDWQLSNSYVMVVVLPYSGINKTTLSPKAVKIIDTLDLIAANTVVSKTSTINL